MGRAEISSANQGEDRKITSRSLARHLFNAEVPEQYVRTLPAESVYLAIKRNGLSASHDILEIVTVEQCRIMLDMDLWNKWSFHEEALWEWLAVTDVEDGLKFLQKLIRCIDLKIVASMIARHVNYVTFDEATEHPPEAGYYTPDNGHTWISLQIEDGTRHFLFGRLLALLFETDAELFYRLLALSQQVTLSELEEEAYQDRTRRLTAEGMPDAERANEINSPLPQEEAAKILSAPSTRAAVQDILPVHPLIYDTSILRPLGELVDYLGAQEEIEMELTLILNAAIVHWGVPFYEFDQVQFLAEKVKGAMNIGLQDALAQTTLTLTEIYDRLGLQKLYALGLNHLMELRKGALALGREPSGSTELQVVIELAALPFPEMPEFLKWVEPSERDTPPTHLDPRPRAIETLEELSKVREALSTPAAR